jgi:hypothetical protein
MFLPLPHAGPGGSAEALLINEREEGKLVALREDYIFYYFFMAAPFWHAAWHGMAWCVRWAGLK